MRPRIDPCRSLKVLVDVGVAEFEATALYWNRRGVTELGKMLRRRPIREGASANVLREVCAPLKEE